MNGQRSIVWFVFLTVTLSFGCYFLPLPAEERLVLVPVVMVLVPALVSVLLAAVTEGRAGLRQLFSRRNGGVKWLVIAVLIGVSLRVAVLVLGKTAGMPVKADLTGAGTWFIVLSTIPLAYFEELGWRRFALERMLKSYSPLVSALILGLPWSIVHLVILMPGMMSEGAPAVPQLMIVFCLSVIFTWLYIRSGGSLLAVTMAHGLQNGLIVINRGVSLAESVWLTMAVYLVFAILLVAFDPDLFFRERPEGLKRQPQLYS